MAICFLLPKPGEESERGRNRPLLTHCAAAVLLYTAVSVGCSVPNASSVATLPKSLVARPELSFSRKVPGSSTTVLHRSMTLAPKVEYPEFILRSCSTVGASWGATRRLSIAPIPAKVFKPVGQSPASTLSQYAVSQFIRGSFRSATVKLLFRKITINTILALYEYVKLNLRFM